MRAFILILLVFSFNVGIAQNLFPNPGFELYNQCPDYTSQINRSVGWDSCVGTADYFNCGYYANSTIGDYGIPSTGTGCVGFICAYPGQWAPNGYFHGETFSGALNATLKPGATYRITADLLSNNVQGPPGDFCMDIGFYFYKSSNPLVLPTVAPFTNPYSAQVRINAGVLLSTYTTQTRDFVADSCYDRVMIGVFSNDSTGTPLCNITGGSAYYDMDNISLVEIQPAPAVSITASSSDDRICRNACLDYIATSNVSVYTWNWILNGSSVNTSTLQNPTAVCYPDAGTFTSTLITTYECSSDTIQLPQIIVEEDPYVEILSDTITDCFGTTKILEAQSNNTIVWNTGNTGASISVKTNGIYIASATSACGTVADTAEIHFEECPCHVYFPNAFTPDGNGKNEIFKVYPDCIFENFSLLVFNRWGQLIYHTDNSENGWDGRTNGEVCPQGVYAALISYTGYDGSKKVKVSKRSHLTLLR